MLSWKLGFIVFLFLLLWIDRLFVKKIFINSDLFEKKFSILLIKLKDKIEFVEI